jgi:DNA-binding Lrp family transcriptional regulator
MAVQATLQPIQTQFDLSKAITMSKFFNRVKLKASTRLILRALVDYYNPNKEYTFPKQNTLADVTGCSRETVISSIEELRSKGLIITIGEKGDSLKYRFCEKFFTLLNFQQPCEKIQHGDVKKCHTMNKVSLTNNITNSNIKKSYNNKNNYNFVQGIQYKTPEATKEELNQSLKLNTQEVILSPYNSKQAAVELIQELKVSGNNDINNMIISKLIKHWNLNQKDELISIKAE